MKDATFIADLGVGYAKLGELRRAKQLIMRAEAIDRDDPGVRRQADAVRQLEARLVASTIPRSV